MWEALSKPWQACVEQAWEAYCAGSIPIGAVIVDMDGAVIVRARNRIFENGRLPFGAKNKEVMHAEIQAIHALDDSQVPPGTAELYTTTEPCPMCLGALYWARVERLYYAATREDAARAGFDDASIYDQIVLPPCQRSIFAAQHLRREALAAFEAWARKEGRVEY